MAMLRVNVIPNTSAAKAYYRSSDYQLEGQESPAFWHGKGAEMLGLSGEIRRDLFELLCENRHPFFTDKHGQPLRLTGRDLENRRVGYDFTFSLSKSASLAATLGGDQRIEAEFRAAVADTMALMEAEMQTRVRQKGADHDRPTGNLVWADFLHRTSRPINGQPDPQLHIHAVVFNATYDREEGQWKAGQFGGIKANGAYFQAAFRSNMANRLQALGYGVTAKNGDFEITGIPDTAIRQFSRRTAQIEKLADQLGIVKPESKAKLGATSRERKDKGLSWEDLLGLWAKRLKPAEAEAIHATVKAAVKPLKPQDRSKEATTYALDHLTERQTVVPERHVITQALKFGLGSVTPESIYKELGSRKDVIRRTKDGYALVTTQKALAWEKAISAFAVKGRGKLKPLVAGGGRDYSAKSVHDRDTPIEPRPQSDLATLSPSQSSAVRHVWASRDRITVIQGRAGTGKTTLTKAAVAGINAAGLPVQMLAPTAAASRGVLRKDGFETADTLAAFLKSAEMQERVRGGVIWLDEAGLASVKDFAALCKLADSLQARIVVSGDARQHKSVAAGDVLALLDRAGLPVSEVTEIKRQEPGKYREVAELFAAGKMNAGLGRLLRHGWVKESGVVDDYLAALDAGKSALVVCPTHAEGERVTEQIRDRLKADGKVKEEREVRRLRPMNLTAAELREAKKQPEEGVVYQKFAAYREETQRLGVGDVIRATAPLKDYARRDIDTGTVMTVTGWTEGGRMRVKTASGAERLLDADCGHISPAYVSTSHASQGRTVDRVLMWMPEASFPAVSQASAYVGATRGRERVTLYTDDLDGLRDAVQRTDDRVSATELVRITPKGVRSRLKRHISWLRSFAAPAIRRQPEPVVQLTQERGMQL